MSWVEIAHIIDLGKKKKKKKIETELQMESRKIAKSVATKQRSTGLICY